MSKASDNFNRVFAQKIFGDDLIDEEATKEAVEAGLDTMMINPDPFEHERLQLAVVEAAKTWFKWHGYIPNLAPFHYEVSLIKTVPELLKFEKEQENPDGNT